MGNEIEAEPITRTANENKVESLIRTVNENKAGTYDQNGRQE